ncbi:MAG: exosortase A [Sphingomonadales bacterium]|nr:exosortase A [Sphingomonadales bacterium]
MQPEAPALAAPNPRLIDRIPAIWHRPLLWLALAWAGIVGLFLADWAAMADQWWDSSTYNHVLLVPAILGWLVALRWGQLQRLVPQGWWPGLVLFAGAVLLWVLGSFAGFSLAKQVAVVAMLIASLMALLGPRVAAGLAFPLGYMAFLVPFGDELIPFLQIVTAKITIALVQLSGVPARIDGVFIDTPAGLFEVAEACSGVKFLIAMIAFGVLVANVCFVSWLRRALFLAACVVIPILANGVRAWGTVYVAQYKGAAYAGGFDHIIYGWVFFAVVIAVTLAAAWRFFDRAVDDRMIDAEALAASPLLGRLEKLSIRPLAALGVMAALVLAGQAWSRAADELSAPVPAHIVLPEVPGWTRADYAPRTWWEPRAQGADHRLLGRYRDAAGHQVDVFYALYAGQDEGKEAGGFGQGALPLGEGWSWQAPGATVPDAKTDRLLSKDRVERYAETYYRTGSLLTGSNTRLKLANIADRLLLRERTTMLLILSAEADGKADPGVGLDAFRKAMGPVDAWMDRVAETR